MRDNTQDLKEVKVYRSQDLLAKGINPEIATTLTFRGKTLSKGVTFTPDQRERAYELCRLYLDTNILSILTDYLGSLTLWFEQKDQRSNTVLSQSSQGFPPSSQPFSSPDPGATIPIEDAPPSNPEPNPSPTPAPAPSSRTSGNRKPITFRGRVVGQPEAMPERPVSQPQPAPPPAPVATPKTPSGSRPPSGSGKTSSKIFFRGRFVSKATPVGNSPTPATPAQEDRYRSFFENATDGLFHMDEEGRYINANPALAKLYGYDSPEELIRTFSQIGIQSYAEPQRRLEFFQQLRQQPSVPPYEGRIYRRDGSTTWIRETVRAVRDPQGALLYYEGSVQEVAPTNADRTPLLGGRYRLLNPLGSGGFGQTFLAEDMHRPKNPLCVVKRLHADSEDPRFLATSQKLFNAEAEILERIGRHPQIPQLLAYFCEEQNFYLVQELIEGHSLDQEIKLGHKMPESQVISILEEVLSILEFVHENKVIHRDIKPTNIIRRKSDGKLVLIDFGAVKEIGTGLSSGGKSSALMAVGTQGYMPIEQCAGRPRFNSDLYAVGILGIEALSGVAAETLQTNPETGELQWHSLVTVSPGLREILDKLVRYHFASRYQTATEVLRDLRALSLS